MIEDSLAVYSPKDAITAHACAEWAAAFTAMRTQETAQRAIQPPSFYA